MPVQTKPPSPAPNPQHDGADPATALLAQVYADMRHPAAPAAPEPLPRAPKL